MMLFIQFYFLYGFSYEGSVVFLLVQANLLYCWERWLWFPGQVQHELCVTHTAPVLQASRGQCQVAQVDVHVNRGTLSLGI